MFTPRDFTVERAVENIVFHARKRCFHAEKTKHPAKEYKKTPKLSVSSFTATIVNTATISNYLIIRILLDIVAIWQQNSTIKKINDATKWARQCLHQGWTPFSQSTILGALRSQPLVL